MDESRAFVTQNIISALVLLSVVSLTVLLALFLALADGMQERRLLPFPTARPFVIGAAATIPPSPTLTPSPAPAQPTATLRPGQTPQTATATLVPIIPLATACPAPAGWQLYTIRRGDTLSAIALRSMKTVDDILTANCLDRSAVIVSGRTLYIPPDVSTFLLGCGPRPGWVYYLVQRGDTLYSLARRHGTTVDQVRYVNCMDNFYLQAGRQILLPLLPPTPVPTATATFPPPTDTATATLAPTATPTETPPPSVTATETAAATPTFTPAPPPSETPTLPLPPTETETSTPEVTPTITPSLTPTPTLSPTFTPDPPTATPTLSTPTITPTPSPFPSETPTSAPAP
ncbi:MAG: LysM peptidoglycan-binding domain-containing protein [Anaerolineae bacterium]|nr:LysM peptidoglycan-binding domain-containing protein [Anaerolineae bacterium]